MTDQTAARAMLADAALDEQAARLAEKDAVGEFFRAVAAGHAPTVPEGAFGLFSGHLVTVTDVCTCAGGIDWPHEEHCGFEPVASLTEIVAALYETKRLTLAEETQ